MAVPPNEQASASEAPCSCHWQWAMLPHTLAIRSWEFRRKLSFGHDACDAEITEQWFAVDMAP